MPFVSYHRMRLIEVEELLKGAIPENTRKATEVWCSALMSFCAQEKIDLDLKTCLAEELSYVVWKFYPALCSARQVAKCGRVGFFICQVGRFN